MSQSTLSSAIEGACVSLAREGGLARVTLSNPGRLNAITVSMWGQLQQVFGALSRDMSVRCVIIRGADGNFAAGADIREFPELRGDTAGVRHYHQEILAPALHAVAECPHPVVAQIEGVCVGGGLEIACQADLRIAGASARFGVPINKLGFSMAPDEMRGLLGLVGRATTLAILLEGRVFDAAEALSLGLLTRVVPDAKVADQTRASAERIMRGAPLAARINKRQSRHMAAGLPLTESDYQDFFSYAESRDHREGVSAFLAGRTPTFTGE
ncbi:enoyl-CoA hydratase/isomerase family protein [Bordetella sp. 15P40C-2]|uniref:enoyl-CoA hydratase/isomerase family protein n=1 Tax=Bordetella sp. 15P40C-2 TaxID=2572246 RepID=UPI0013264463|nr:enoyl-CoA hydratase/isomerase family protein [Bordetella sp. 15P40C-2]MVW73659.1 enoyl-CoA hydratase/isomerase family protein [Bordetella sp. 15P40C-2]